MELKRRQTDDLARQGTKPPFTYLKNPPFAAVGSALKQDTHWGPNATMYPVVVDPSLAARQIMNAGGIKLEGSTISAATNAKMRPIPSGSIPLTLGLSAAAQFDAMVSPAYLHDMSNAAGTSAGRLAGLSMLPTLQGRWIPEANALESRDLRKILLRTS